MDPVIIAMISLGLDAVTQAVANGKMKKAELADILAKADALKVATDAIVDDYLDAVGD